MTTPSQDEGTPDMEWSDAQWDDVLRVAFGSSPVGRPAPDAAEWEVVGRFEVDGVLGRGGMGTVLRGRDQELARDVAIKVLSPEHAAHPRQRRRFLREGRILGALQHPGIVPIYELGHHSSGVPYLAMKLIEGETLQAILADQPPLARRLSIFLSVCQTVAYAHARDVVHRDLKPANVMVGPFGEVQVLDWGLGKVLGEEETNDSTTAFVPPTDDAERSQSGEVVGTFAYMAPEQAGGRVDAIDRRSDVFSLGSMLCEVLTGAPAYRGRELRWQRAAEAQLDDAFARLEACDADEALRQLARRCLDPSADRRPPDADHVAREVEQWFSATEERVRASERATYEARAVAQQERRARRLTGALAAAVVVLLVAAAVGAVWVQRVQDRRRIDTEAQLEPVVEAARTARSDALTLAKAGWRVGVDPGGMRGPVDSDWFECPERPAWEAALEHSERALQMALRGPVSEERLASVRTMRDEIRDATDAVRIEEATLAREAVLFGRLGAIFDRMGIDPWSDLERAYHEAFLEFGLDVDVMHPDALVEALNASSIPVELAEGLFVWVRAKFRMGAFVDGTEQDVLIRFMEVIQRVDPDPWRLRIRSTVLDGRYDSLRLLADHEDVAAFGERNLLFLAVLLHDIGARNDGLEQSIRLLESQLGRFPDSFDLHQCLGEWCMEAGRPRDAVRPLAVARALRPSVLLVQLQSAECASALEQWSQALAAFDAVLVAEPERRDALLGRARAWAGLGDFERAMDEAEELFDDDRDDPAVLTLMAELLDREGRREEADARLDDAIEVLGKPSDKDVVDPGSRHSVQQRRLLATLLEEMGRLPRARAVWETLVGVLPEAEFELARVECLLGRASVALSMWQRQRQRLDTTQVRAWLEESKRVLVVEESVAERAFGVTPDSRLDRATLARLWFDAGEAEESARLWDAAGVVEGRGPPGLRPAFLAACACLAAAQETTDAQARDRAWRSAVTWFEADLLAADDPALRLRRWRRDARVRWLLSDDAQSKLPPDLARRVAARLPSA